MAAFPKQDLVELQGSVLVRDALFQLTGAASATRAMEKFDIADPYVWGFRKSRGEVDKLLEYSHRQGLVSRRFVPEDTFHASTLDR